MRYEEFIKQTVEDYVKNGQIRSEDYPDMELYMDQAVLFLNRNLDVYKKDEKDQVITKTMVGNYAKHKMIPRPVNKRYTADHLILLTIIFYLKGTFQMDEIEALMKPIVDNYNSEFDDKYNLKGIYEAILKIDAGHKETMKDNIYEEIEMVKDSLDEVEHLDDDMMELFMFIVNLAMKADAQKFVAQKLLNEYFINPKKK